MRFVDREKEIARLQQLLKGDSPYFVIIRGRRRIGKSTLIGKVLCEKDIYNPDWKGITREGYLL